MFQRYKQRGKEMKFQLYDKQTGKEATQEEYAELFLSNQGELLQYYDMREMMDTPEKDWKIIFVV